MPNKVLLITSKFDVSYTRAFIQTCGNFCGGIDVGRPFYPNWKSVVEDCKRRGCKAIATSQFPFFNELEGSAEDNYGYSYIRDGIHVVLLPSLKRLYSERHMRFYIGLLTHKVAAPDKFLTPATFGYDIINDEADLAPWLDVAEVALCKAIDIETGPKEYLVMTSVAYTFIVYKNGRLHSHSIVLDFHKDPMRKLAMVRKLNATKSPAIMQNGQYDAAYFLRFNAPVDNWFFDTYNLHHCMYVELDKDLSFLARTYLHETAHWKEMAGYNKLEYNARDTHATAWAWLGMLWHIRTTKSMYALRNYYEEFPNVFPSTHCAMEGIKVIPEVRAKLFAEETQKAENAVARLQRLLGQEFNPGSSQQVVKLMRGLDFEPPKVLKDGVMKDSTDKKALQKFKEANPLYGKLVEIIEEARKAKKAASTYFNFDLLNGRCMYQLNPAGTETGRFSSKQSDYWVGTQVQNQPPYAKAMYIADDGFLLAEIDKKSSESYCTGFISREEKLLHVLRTSPDFHCANASMFFGIPFEELYDAVLKKVIRKDIRNVAKRVNHGANYNMGPFVLWETMGTKAVYEAAALLKLPPAWGPMAICAYLLECFKRAYPRIKGEWQDEVIEEVRTTGRLVGATGWTRITFLQPWDNKLDLNSCIAHHPQSLSALIVNRCFRKAWRLQIEKYPRDMRLKAPIHDSLFFQYREGHEHIVREVQDIMNAESVIVHGKEMLIGTDAGFGEKIWGNLK